MSYKKEFIELQGTGEESPFTYSDLLSLIELGSLGCLELIEVQRNILGNEICSRILG